MVQSLSSILPWWGVGGVRFLSLPPSPHLFLSNPIIAFLSPPLLPLSLSLVPPDFPLPMFLLPEPLRAEKAMDSVGGPPTVGDCWAWGSSSEGRGQAQVPRESRIKISIYVPHGDLEEGGGAGWRRGLRKEWRVREEGLEWGEDS